MGKMKALFIEMQENGEMTELHDDDDEDLSMYEEAHYHHVINDFVSLIDEHGWPKVIGDVREKLVQRDWWSPC
jgi:hypothetical protein